jgi:hypothetical protein
MLWAIHEWCQDRPAGRDMLFFYEIATLVGGGEYVDPSNEDPDKPAAKKFQAEQINLFQTLVEREGLIDATIHRPVVGMPVTQATVRGLTGPGLRLIRELPDPNRSLTGALDDITLAIRNLRDVDEEEKDAAAKAAEELKTFARNLAPAAAVQLLAAVSRSLLGPG